LSLGETYNGFMSYLIEVYMSHFDEKFKTEAMQAIPFLLTASTFFKSGYAQKLKEVPTRFNTAECTAVIEKQWKEFNRTMLHATDKPETVKDMNHQIAAMLEELAVRISKIFNVKIPTKKSYTFRCKGDECLIGKFNELLPSARNEEVRIALSSMDHYCQLNSFYAREVLCGVYSFGSMMKTLSQETPYSKYEDFIKKQMQVPGWFSHGHPYDLLVIDLEILKNARSNNVKAIYTNPERCSTQAMYPDTKLCESKTLLVTTA
jgi:hypothetical protein